MGQAWASVGEDPDEIDGFQIALKDAVVRLLSRTLRAGASRFIQCRAQGLLDGVKGRLRELQDEVRVACLIDGVFWGELAAELYCELAFEFGGLAFLNLEFPPLQEATCGQAFETSCQSEYSLFVDFFCPEFAFFPHVESFAENRRLSCTYLAPE